MSNKPFIQAIRRGYEQYQQQNHTADHPGLLASTSAFIRTLNDNGIEPTQGTASDNALALISVPNEKNIQAIAIGLFAYGIGGGLHGDHDLYLLIKKELMADERAIYKAEATLTQDFYNAIASMSLTSNVNEAHDLLTRFPDINDDFLSEAIAERLYSYMVSQIAQKNAFGIPDDSIIIRAIKKKVKQKVFAPLDVWTITTEQRKSEKQTYTLISKIANVDEKTKNFLKNAEKFAQYEQRKNEDIKNSTLLIQVLDAIKHITPTKLGKNLILPETMPSHEHYIAQLKSMRATESNFSYMCFITNTVFYLVDWISTEHSFACESSTISALVLYATIPTLEPNEQQEIYQSMRNALSLLIKKGSNYYVYPRLMVDAFIDFDKHLHIILNKFNLSMAAFLQDKDTKEIIAKAWVRMFFAATTNEQEKGLRKSAFYAEVKNTDIVQSALGSNQLQSSTAKQTIDFLAALLAQANAYLNDFRIYKPLNFENVRCAEQIRDIASMNANPRLTLVRILLLIIDFRIDAHKSDERVYDKKLYREYLEHILETHLNHLLVKQDLEMYRPYFREQIYISLNNIAPLDHNQAEKMISLKKSILFFEETLGLKSDTFEAINYFNLSGYDRAPEKATTSSEVIDNDGIIKAIKNGCAIYESKEAAKNYFAKDASSIQAEELLASAKMNDHSIILINFFKNAMIGSGLLNDCISKELDKIANHVYQMTDVLLNAYTREAMVFFRQNAPLHLRETDKCLSFILNFNYNNLFESMTNERIYRYIMRNIEDIQTLIQIPLIQKALKYSNTADEFIKLIQVLKHKESLTAWLLLIHHDIIFADQLFDGQTYMSYMAYVEENRSNFTSKQDYRIWVEALLADPTFKLLTPEKQGKILSLVYEPVTGATALQQLVRMDLQLKQNNQISPEHLKLILHLLGLPVHVDYEKEKYWIEYLLNIESTVFSLIINKIPEQMFKAFYVNGIHERIAAQLPDILTISETRRAQIIANHCYLIQKIINPHGPQGIETNINAYQKADAFMKMAKGFEVSEPSTYIGFNTSTWFGELVNMGTYTSHPKHPDKEYTEQLKQIKMNITSVNEYLFFSSFFIANTIMYLAKIALGKHEDDIYKYYIFSILEKIDLVVPGTYMDELYQSIQNTCAILLSTDSPLNTKTYAQADLFVNMMHQFVYIFNKFKLDPQKCPLFKEMLTRVQFLSTPLECRMLKQSIGRLNIVTLNDNKLEYVKNNTFVEDLFKAATLYLESPSSHKLMNDGNKNCALFIQELFKQSANSFNRIQAILRIIDFQISSHKQDERVFNKKFYRDYLRPILNSLKQNATENLMLYPREYKQYYICQISRSLKNIGTLDFYDEERMVSLKDSLQLFLSLLKLNMQHFDLDTQLIFTQLGLKTSEWQFVLNNKHHDFMKSIQFHASNYKNDTWNKHKKGNLVSMCCAAAIASLPYDEGAVDDVKRTSLMQAMIYMISYCIMNYKNEHEYEKTLYIYFESTLKKSGPLSLDDASKDILLQEIDKGLKELSPTTEDQSERIGTLRRLQSLLAALSLFANTFALDAIKLQKILMDSHLIVKNDALASASKVVLKFTGAKPAPMSTAEGLSSVSNSYPIYLPGYYS